MCVDREQLAQAWNEVVDAYAAYFVPRFEPWVRAAVDAFCGHAAGLPAGCVVVPCCGTGAELVGLRDATLFAGRRLVGVDISDAMIARARATHGEDPRVVFSVGDASDLSPFVVEPIAGLVSCFGLQQMPAPDVALGGWVRALAPRGVLSVLFWPPHADPSDAVMSAFDRALRQCLGESDVSWNERLVGAVAGAGGDVLRDEPVRHEQRHDGAEALWAAMTRGGRMRALALRVGDAAMQRVGERFLAALPRGPLAHVSAARLIVARRSP